MQIIAIPVPFSGSASAWARTDGHPEQRRHHLGPNSGLYRSSSGWATSATHAGISSGRVVSISRKPASGRIGTLKANAVIRTGLLAVFELCLGDCRSEIDIP